MNLTRSSIFLSCGVLMSSAVLVVLLPGCSGNGESKKNDTAVFKEYVGSASCRECHPKAFGLWVGSHHAQAERMVKADMDRPAFDPPRTLQHGTQKSFFQWREGQAQIAGPGLLHPWETNAVVRVIGEDPLRQYLIAYPGGRLQVQEASFAPRSNDWFNVFGNEDRKPGEWGHWTGRGMNWNAMCASCHNTRVQKNYDAGTDTYHTTMAEATVSCEACHGPLKAHVDWEHKHGGTAKDDPTFPKLSRQQTADMCASCHARRSDLTGDFTPGDEFNDHFELATVDASDLFYPDGQIRDEDYEASAFLGSKMQHAGLTCLDCHPRSLHMARLHGNELCMQCHKTGLQKAPVINPTEHSHHAVGSTGNECAGCHMPQTLYMQRHWRHDHGFTIPDPLLTKQLGIPNACNRCHANQSTDWSLKNVEAWYGEKMQRHTRDRALIISRARAGDESSPTNLVRLLQTEEIPYWRAVAATLLLNWSTETTVTPALLRGLDDTNALVRSACVRALEPMLGESAVASNIEKKLVDPLRNVRVAAAWVLRAKLDTNTLAAADLKRFLDQNADQPVGQLQLGTYLFARGDLEAACKHMQTAVAWDEFSTPLRLELAVVLSALGRAPEATAQLKIACQKAPRDAQAHFSLGLALNEQGDQGQARKEMETAVEIEPNFARAWYNLGLLQNAAGEALPAMKSLIRGEKAAPTDPSIPYARATILARLGRTQEAIAVLRRVLELHPEAVEARQLLERLAQ